MVTTIGIGSIEATLSIGARGETRQAIVDNSAPLSMPPTPKPGRLLSALPSPYRPSQELQPATSTLATPRQLALLPPHDSSNETYLIRREDIFSPHPAEARYNQHRVDPGVAFHDMIEELRERNDNLRS